MLASVAGHHQRGLLYHAGHHRRGHFADGRRVVAFRAFEGLAAALHQSRRNVETWRG